MKNAWTFFLLFALHSMSIFSADSPYKEKGQPYQKRPQTPRPRSTAVLDKTATREVVLNAKGQPFFVWHKGTPKTMPPAEKNK